MEGSQKSKNVILFPLEGVSRLPLGFFKCRLTIQTHSWAAKACFAHNLPTAKKEKKLKHKDE